MTSLTLPIVVQLRSLTDILGIQHTHCVHNNTVTAWSVQFMNAKCGLNIKWNETQDGASRHLFHLKRLGFSQEGSIKQYSD
jgi:hypothetical protein